jgi:tRNA (guanine-N7-)-methyltransferase
MDQAPAVNSKFVRPGIELVPETYVAPLDLLSTFGREAPLHVDLGCGDGDLLCELARRYPRGNFLGVEKLAGRVAKACRKSALLENVRVLKLESTYAVRYLLPEASVETFYLLFPDPWPKRRHHRRRIVTNDFLDSIHRALESGGTLRIATDQRDYFEQIARVCRNDSRFVILDSEDADLPTTKFERRFAAADAPIYRLALRKVSPVT